MTSTIRESLRLTRATLRTLAMRLCGRLSRPELIVFEVTDACNSRCKHCQIWQEKPTADLISPAEVQQVLRDPLFRDLKVVLLTGGEPVLRKDIHELIEGIHEVHPRAQISLSTNALLPDRVLETVTRALEKGITINVGVSVDAVGDRHDEIRGVKGNFERVDRLFKGLAELKQRFGARMGDVVAGHTLSNLTLDTMEEVREYACSRHVTFLTQLHEEFPFYHNDSSTEATWNYRKTDNALLIRAVERLPKGFHNTMLLAALKHQLKFRCAALRTFFLLRCNGSVAPCLNYCTRSIGNVRKQDPTSIWRGEAAVKERAFIAKCPCCSNTWATEFSMTYWPPSFARQFLQLLRDKIAGRT
jgi:MoaA/NifB/PqqE/SkfB family radical SAM enzyme